MKFPDAYRRPEIFHILNIFIHRKDRVRFVFASVLLFVIFGVALDRLRLGKMHVNLLLRSACTIFALKSKTRRQIYEIFPVHRTCAQRVRHGYGRCRSRRFGRHDRFYIRYLRGAARFDPQRRCHGSQAAAPLPSGRVLAPYQRPLPAARAAGHRRCDLLAGAADDLFAYEPPHYHLVVFLRTDRGFGAARRQTDRPLGLADRAGFRRRGRRGVVDHRRNARRNA